MKQTCSLGLWEPVSPPGPGAVAVFLLGSQRARRGQVGPALQHGDLAVSVPCIIAQRLLWLRDLVAGTAERAVQGSARGRFSLSGPVGVAGKTGCAGRASGAGLVVAGGGFRERCRALCINVGMMGVGSCCPRPVVLSRTCGCSGGDLSISTMALTAVPGRRLRLGPLFQIALPGSEGASARPPEERPERQAGEGPLLFLCCVHPHLNLTGFKQGRLSLSFKTTWVCGSAGMMQACPTWPLRRVLPEPIVGTGAVSARVRIPHSRGRADTAPGSCL